MNNSTLKKRKIAPLVLLNKLAQNKLRQKPYKEWESHEQPRQATKVRYDTQADDMNSQLKQGVFKFAMYDNGNVRSPRKKDNKIAAIFAEKTKRTNSLQRSSRRNNSEGQFESVKRDRNGVKHHDIFFRNQVATQPQKSVSPGSHNSNDNLLHKIRSRLQKQRSQLIPPNHHKQHPDDKDNHIKLSHPPSQSQPYPWFSSTNFSPSFSNINSVLAHKKRYSTISKFIHDRKESKQLITAVRDYVLEEQGEASDMELMFQSNESKHSIKKIIFLERMLMICVVDCILKNHRRTCDPIFRSALDMLNHFYDFVAKCLQHYNGQEAPNLEKPEKKAQLSLQKSQKLQVSHAPLQSQSESQFYSLISKTLHRKLSELFSHLSDKKLSQFFQLQMSSMAQQSSNQLYYNILQFYSYKLMLQSSIPSRSIHRSLNVQFLQSCPSPYLHYDCPRKYTLVLDMDQTLIHYRSDMSKKYGQFLLRPHLFQFLQICSQFFEVGIFTSSMPQYANMILNKLPKISFRLFRHHTIKIHNEYVKDLSRLGRDLSKTIIVDNIERNYRLQPQNGILIRSWYDDQNDEMLKTLANELLQLVARNPHDIRNQTFLRAII